MNAESGRLRVAMLAPVAWPVPPDGYGPWEQVVSNLTEGLVASGHEVTLFAAAGSQTSAHLVETVPHAGTSAPRRVPFGRHGQSRLNPPACRCTVLRALRRCECFVAGREF